MFLNRLTPLATMRALTKLVLSIVLLGACRPSSQLQVIVSTPCALVGVEIQGIVVDYALRMPVSNAEIAIDAHGLQDCIEATSNQQWPVRLISDDNGEFAVPRFVVPINTTFDIELKASNCRTQRISGVGYEIFQHEEQEPATFFMTC